MNFLKDIQKKAADTVAEASAAIDQKIDDAKDLLQSVMTLISLPERITDPNPPPPPEPLSATVDDTVNEDEKQAEFERKKKEEEERKRKQKLLEAQRKKEREERLKKEAEERRRREEEKRKAEKKKFEEEELKKKQEAEAALKAQNAADAARIQKEQEERKKWQEAEAARLAKLHAEEKKKAEELAKQQAAAAAASGGAVGAKKSTWTSIAEFVNLQMADAVESDDEMEEGDKDAAKSGAASPAPKAPIPGKMTCLFTDGKTPIYTVKDNDELSFYNESTWDLQVEHKYGPNSKLTVMDKDNVKHSTDAKGWGVYKTTVHPRSTVRFVKGSVNGMSGSYGTASPSDAYKKKMEAEKSTKIESELKAAKAGDEEATLKNCLAKNIPFVDPTFVPGKEAIGEGLQTVPFERPQGWLPDGKKARLFTGGAEPNDIAQGSLGDCYFLCSLSGVAEFQEHIRDLFRHPVPFAEGRALRRKEQALGAYRVVLNKGGWWRNMILDDYIPSVGGPVFGKNATDNSEMWVAMLEKAWAKAHGNYGNIVGGDALQALTDLTGFPSTRFNDEEWNKNPNKMFQRILAADQAGYLININTPGSDDSAYMGASGAKNSQEFTKRYKDAGLGMGHAYVILRAVEIKSKNLQLVQIRNPWGNGTEWTGAWGDDSDLWAKNPDVAKVCEFAPGEDGTFWMLWSDARTYFDSGGGICYLRPRHTDYRVRGQFQNGSPSVSLEVRVTGDKPLTVLLTVSQNCGRGKPKGHPDRSHEALCLTVAKYDAAVRKHASDGFAGTEEITPSDGAVFCRGWEMAMEYTFLPRPEPYLVFPRIHSSAGNKNKEYVLGFLTPQEADGTNLTVSFKTLSPDFRGLKNFVQYPYNAEVAKPVTTEFQVKAPRCAPVTTKGEQLRQRWEILPQ